MTAMEDTNSNFKMAWTLFLITLTTVIIVLSVGIQSKDTSGGGAFLGMNTQDRKSLTKLVVVFPICYFVFIRQIRKLKNNHLKGSFFLVQGLGILFFAFYIVDNSHPGVDMQSLAAEYSIYKSNTFVFVYIVPILNFIVATSYFVGIKIHDRFW